MFVTAKSRQAGFEAKKLGMFRLDASLGRTFVGIFEEVKDFTLGADTGRFAKVNKSFT